MKNGQIKQEVINYLTKTSQHSFVNECGQLFKITQKDGKFYIFDESSTSPYHKIFTPIDIDAKILRCGSNAKCVIKHQLFLNKKMKSIKIRSNNAHRLENFNSLISKL